MDSSAKWGEGERLVRTSESRVPRDLIPKPSEQESLSEREMEGGEREGIMWATWTRGPGYAVFGKILC